MSSIHYKFRNSKDYSTITFDGAYIALGDLKTEICKREFGKVTDIDLKVTNAQTNEGYTGETTNINKNSSVIVARIPVSKTSKRSGSNRNNAPPSAIATSIVAGGSHGGAAASTVPATAEEAEAQLLESVMNQADATYGQSTWQDVRRRPDRSAPLPPHYICYRCGKQGHRISDCPTNGMKMTTGIPRSQLVEVDDPDFPGAMLNANGTYAVYKTNPNLKNASAAAKPPPPPQTGPKEVPAELKCPICSQLLRDAVIVPCCGKSFCDECIRTRLMDTFTCPACGKEDTSPANLIPVPSLRQSVASFRAQQQSMTNAAGVAPVPARPPPGAMHMMQHNQLNQQQPPRPRFRRPRIDPSTLHPNYVCRLCGIPGHHIKDCPSIDGQPPMGRAPPGPGMPPFRPGAPPAMFPRSTGPAPFLQGPGGAAPLPPFHPGAARTPFNPGPAAPVPAPAPGPGLGAPPSDPPGAEAVPTSGPDAAGAALAMMDAELQGEAVKTEPGARGDGGSTSGEPGGAAGDHTRPLPPTTSSNSNGDPANPMPPVGTMQAAPAQRAAPPPPLGAPGDMYGTGPPPSGMPRPGYGPQGRPVPGFGQLARPTAPPFYDGGGGGGGAPPRGPYGYRGPMMGYGPPAGMRGRMPQPGPYGRPPAPGYGMRYPGPGRPPMGMPPYMAGPPGAAMGGAPPPLSREEFERLRSSRGRSGSPDNRQRRSRSPSRSRSRSRSPPRRIPSRSPRREPARAHRRHRDHGERGERYERDGYERSAAGDPDPDRDYQHSARDPERERGRGREHGRERYERGGYDDSAAGDREHDRDRQSSRDPEREQGGEREHGRERDHGREREGREHRSHRSARESRDPHRSRDERERERERGGEGEEEGGRSRRRHRGKRRRRHRSDADPDASQSHRGRIVSMHDDV